MYGTEQPTGAELEDASSKPPLIRPRSRFGEDGPVYTGSHDFRGAFVRKVYSLLTCQMVMTVILVAICMYSPSIRNSIVASPRTWFWSTAVPMYILLIALVFVRNQHPVNYYCFFGFTAGMALHVGIVAGMLTAYGLVCFCVFLLFCLRARCVCDMF